MPRFVRLLAEGMRARGHEVEERAPQGFFVQIPLRGLHKWLGYIDQYLLFPLLVRYKLRKDPANTLFVFTDHALGPWVPLVANRPHVIHCHDFLAQRSARGEISENPTGWTGRLYQRYIRRGYTRGHHFISVSQSTRQDLHRLLPALPVHSEVVYNGLNQKFAPQDIAQARNSLSQATGLDLTVGYLLHVGGNQWYKNRAGVIELYAAWRASSSMVLPLLLIGEAPDSALLEKWAASGYQSTIYWLEGLDDDLVRLAYAGASVFLFPSLAEGFGWPIAEAMASGCPVITTGERPMTEVGGKAAFYILRRPSKGPTAAWAVEGAQVIQQVVTLNLNKRSAVAHAGLVNAKRFEAHQALNHIESIYQRILAQFGKA